MEKTELIRKTLEEAKSFADAGQSGDPNGAKCYQASKLIGFSLGWLDEVSAKK